MKYNEHCPPLVTRFSSKIRIRVGMCLVEITGYDYINEVQPDLIGSDKAEKVAVEVYRFVNELCEEHGVGIERITLDANG